MLDNEKESVLKVINSLWKHDAWNWGNTCAKLINQEIDWSKPAILDIDGEYITANVYTKDGREFQVGYQEGGWFMCFIKDCDDPRARLTKRAPLDPFDQSFTTQYALAKRIGDSRYGSECQHEKGPGGYCIKCLRSVR